MEHEASNQDQAIKMRRTLALEVRWSRSSREVE